MIDLSEATFIDSSVLSALILAQQRVDQDDNEQLAIVAPPAGLPAQLIDMADATRLFSIFERRGDALDWIDRSVHTDAG